MQSKTQVQNFMRGAMLITMAQLVTKLLGAVHRPAAQAMIGDTGLALATPPSYAYYIILAISSVGLNVAISRLVSERLALEDYRGARRVFHVASVMLVISGLVFSLLFGFGAKWMASLFHMPEAWLGFAALAPALFLVSVLCVFRGLYQGMQQMQPSAMSQVVEQLARVSISLVLIAALAQEIHWGAAAFNAGNTIGIGMAVLYFIWVYLKQRPTANWATTAPGVASYEHASVSLLLGKILAIAAPLALMGAVLPIMGLADSAIVINRLMAIGVPEHLAEQAQAWLSNAGTLRDLPTILTTALYISLVPAIAESVATNQMEQARYRTGTAFRLTFLIGLPATVALLVSGRDVYSILYTGSGWTVMSPLALSCIFMMVQQTSSGALQGMGRIWTSVRNMLTGVAVKVLLTWWWTGLPGHRENGAAYATVVGFLVAAALQLVALRQYMGFRINWRGDAVKPLAASAMMGVAIWGASLAVHRVIHSPRLAGLIVVAVGAAVYLVAVLAVGGITMADIGLIPGFPQRGVLLLRRYRLLRG
ncbi:MAG TPA: polysaccharide biosynthesis protein [Symbiobacteriaceae bacterium]|nr:polysaccharide biosynthesis protein [Symbiobacteriaceae bacterium]